MADEKFVEQISEEVKKFGDNIVKIKERRRNKLD